MSNILYDAIFDTKLAGTRLFFAYYIFMGIYHLKMYEDYVYKIHDWIQFLQQGYSPTIELYGSRFLDTRLDQVLVDQLSHTMIRGAVIGGVQLLTYYKAPWQNGFILNIPGLTNYRGFIEPDPIVQADHELYK